jgi:hypothetical protein
MGDKALQFEHLEGLHVGTELSRDGVEEDIMAKSARRRIIATEATFLVYTVNFDGISLFAHASDAKSCIQGLAYGLLPRCSKTVCTRIQLKQGNLENEYAQNIRRHPLYAML